MGFALDEVRIGMGSGQQGGGCNYQPALPPDPYPFMGKTAGECASNCLNAFYQNHPQDGPCPPIPGSPQCFQMNSCSNQDIPGDVACIEIPPHAEI